MTFEVRDFAGKVYYSGEEEIVARNLYEKMAATQAPVTLLELKTLDVTPAFEQHRANYRNAVPWSPR